MKLDIFFVNDYKIDLTRSLITSPSEQINAEPKILQVLRFLAERQGEVVTHQEIMNTVWQGVVVAPNTLQRSIGQLRKMLSDDAKQQKVIATHPRIGYRLVADVTWQHDKLNQQASHSKPSKHPFSTFIVVCIISLFFIIGSVFYLQGSRTKVAFSSIKQLTQSDQNEVSPIYSLDGRYIVFNRRTTGCLGSLWAKNVESGAETELTQVPAGYGQLSFSPDGNQLVFSINDQCVPSTIELTTDFCWHLATVDFATALAHSQAPIRRVKCHPFPIETPKALSNNQYAFLEYNDRQYSLVHYDERTKTRKTLFESKQHFIYYFDYHDATKTFAVISRNAQQQDVLHLLSASGAVVQENVIERPQNMSAYQFFEANFVPSGEYLLTSSFLGPYQLDLTGKLEPITVPENKVTNIHMHPKEHKLLAIRGEVDNDIALVSRDGGNQPVKKGGYNVQYQPFVSFARTTSSEHSAKFQPNGELISFISNRSGTAQIWLWSQQNAIQLTFEQNNQRINNSVWSRNGDKIAYILNDELAVVTPSGKLEVIKAPLPLRNVLDWYGEHELLVLANNDKVRQLYSIDLRTGALTDLSLNSIKHAWVVDKNIIYVDQKGRVLERHFDKPNQKPIKVKGAFSESILVKNENVYTVDPNNLVLKKINVMSKRAEYLEVLKPNAWWLSDIQDENILVDQAIGRRSEVVELR